MITIKIKGFYPYKPINKSTMARLNVCINDTITISQDNYQTARNMNQSHTDITLNVTLHHINEKTKLGRYYVNENFKIECDIRIDKPNIMRKFARINNPNTLN